MTSIQQRDHFLIPLFFLLFLLSFSSFYNYQINQDSYQHFQTSVEVWKTGNWKALITDTWNRPFSAFFYGISGQQGIIFARWVSVFFAFLTSLGIYKIICCISKYSIQKNFLIPIAIFFGQLPIVPESVVTMTEIPAAFLLAWGFFFHCTKQHFLSFLILGFLPLARLEMSLIMAWLFIIFSVQHVLKENGSWNICFKAMQWCCVGSLPFILWWVIGFYLTENFFWLLSSSHVIRFREFNLDILTINALTSLNGVFSSSALLLFILGCLQFSKILKPEFCSCWFVSSGYGIIVIYFVFSSMFVVYPQGSPIFGHLGIAAVNPRNFNVISPILALFIFAGMTCLLDIKSSSLHIQKFWIALSFTALLVIGFFLFQQTFGTSFKKGLFKLILQSIILFILVVWFVSHLDLRQKRYIPINFNTLSLFLIASFVWSVPLFWHPLKFYDQRFIVQKELCSWLKTQAKVPMIVQDVNSRLDQFCQFTLHAPWEWSQFFEEKLKQSPIGSWFIVEGNQDYVPHSRYSTQLLQSAQYAMIKKSQPTAVVSSWEKLLNKISSRNKPMTWIIYEKQSY